MMKDSSGSIAAFVAVYTDNTQNTLNYLAAKSSLSTAYDKTTTTNTGQQVYVTYNNVSLAYSQIGTNPIGFNNYQLYYFEPEPEPEPETPPYIDVSLAFMININTDQWLNKSNKMNQWIQLSDMKNLFLPDTLISSCDIDKAIVYYKRDGNTVYIAWAPFTYEFLNLSNIIRYKLIQTQ